jgi:hypothetical protein
MWGMTYCRYDIALFNQTFLNIKNIYQGRLNDIIGPGQNSALGPYQYNHSQE